MSSAMSFFSYELFSYGFFNYMNSFIREKFLFMKVFHIRTFLSHHQLYAIYVTCRRQFHTNVKTRKNLEQVKSTFYLLHISLVAQFFI